MTDNEIIKALECCICSTSSDDCEDLNCPAYQELGCYFMDRSTEYYPESLIQEIGKSVLDLINRQKAEIERLNEKITAKDENNYYFMGQLRLAREKLLTAKSEAIKEFSNELIKTLKYALYGLDIKEKTISKEEVQKRFELLMHKDIPEVIEYVKNKMVGDEK